MAEKQTGDTTLRELRPAYEGDPVYGLRIVRRFEGPHDDAVAQGQLFILAGSTISIDPVPPNRAILYVRTPNPQEPNQPPVDTWERTTELVQEDIRNNARLIASITSTVPDPLKSSAINAYYKDFKQKIRDGGPYQNTVPELQAMFDLMSQGADAFLVRRIVLRRRRIIPSNVPAQSDVSALERFYSTARLIDTFSVPQDVASKLPVTSTPAPSNTQWGWMERMDTSIVTPAYAQTEEVKDWVFAAWSTLLYDYIS